MPSINDARVTNAIAAAEASTSGEIRVLLSQEKAPEPVAAAEAHFARLGMTKTAARNGVLIYLSLRSRTFAIIGDAGIHEKCGDAFWRLLAAAMEVRFKKGEFTEGLVEGIEHAGKLLAENFPRSPDDRNELPDKIERAE